MVAGAVFSGAGGLPSPAIGAEAGASGAMRMVGGAAAPGAHAAPRRIPRPLDTIARSTASGMRRYLAEHFMAQSRSPAAHPQLVFLPPGGGGGGGGGVAPPPP